MSPRKQIVSSRKKTKKATTFSYALKSFSGYLEGTGKSAHTIKNYRYDLKTFQEYLKKGLGSDSVSLSEVSYHDLEKYDHYLKKNQLKTNTRRRKLLTVRHFLSYLTKRNRFALDVGKKIPAPYKVERVPEYFSIPVLLKHIHQLPIEDELSARNRLLLWVLCETGCLVSEIANLRAESFDLEAKTVSITGKNQRVVPVSTDLIKSVAELNRSKKSKNGDKGALFFGYNRFGPLKMPISSRGVELLVKSYSLKFGMAGVTARKIRHSVVVHWWQSGVDRAEIQRRLGLKTTYSFRMYEPIFKEAGDTTGDLYPSGEPSPKR